MNLVTAYPALVVVYVGLLMWILMEYASDIMMNWRIYREPQI